MMYAESFFDFATHLKLFLYTLVRVLNDAASPKLCPKVRIESISHLRSYSKQNMKMSLQDPRHHLLQ